MSERKEAKVGAQMVDELKLQAWLAKAELENPSVDAEVHEEANVLAQMRDELRLQAHLGKMEAAEEFHELEQHWRDFMHHADQQADDIKGRLQGFLGKIREGYDQHIKR